MKYKPQYKEIYIDRYLLIDDDIKERYQKIM